MSITCPACGMTSHNPNDEIEGYCGNCHRWTSDHVYTRETREQVAALERAAEILAARSEHRVANEVYGVISRMARTPTKQTTVQKLSEARRLSKMLWDARELIEMFGDVIDSRIPGKSTWATRLVAEIDEYRVSRGWSRDGFGGEHG